MRDYFTPFRGQNMDENTRPEDKRSSKPAKSTRAQALKKRHRMRVEIKILLVAIVTLCFLIIVGLIAIVFSNKGNSGKVSSVTKTPDNTANNSTPTVSPTELPVSTPVPTVVLTDTPIPTSTMTPVPTSSATKADLKLSNGYAVINDTVWSTYQYNAGDSVKHSDALNALTKKLDTNFTIYEILVPTSIGITFPEHLKEFVNSSDQKSAIAEIYGRIDKRVKTVNVYDALFAGRGENIYLRTDTRWTSYGAYLAYAEFLKAKGLEAASADSYAKKSYEGFLGNTIAQLPAEVRKSSPDTIEVMIPASNADMEITDTAGEKKSWPMLGDGNDLAAKNKYMLYLGGDYPFTKIVNRRITDGSSCIVVKESYGNAFVPFLTDNYEYIYVVDYRSYRGSFSKLAKELRAKDIIVINSMSTTANTKLLGQLYHLLSY